MKWFVFFLIVTLVSISFFEVDNHGDKKMTILFLIVTSMVAVYAFIIDWTRHSYEFSGMTGWRSLLIPIHSGFLGIPFLVFGFAFGSLALLFIFPGLILIQVVYVMVYLRLKLKRYVYDYTDEKRVLNIPLSNEARLKEKIIAGILQMVKLVYRQQVVGPAMSDNLWKCCHGLGLTPIGSWAAFGRQMQKGDQS